jgi:rRNA small subunit pseudouridine methyltransferase Nep1
MRAPLTRHYHPLPHLSSSFAAYVAALGDGVPVVFVVGAMAHGHVDVSYTDDFISVSEFPLSAACCIGRICNALEAKYDIV